MKEKQWGDILFVRENHLSKSKKDLVAARDGLQDAEDKVKLNIKEIDLLKEDITSIQANIGKDVGSGFDLSGVILSNNYISLLREKIVNLKANQKKLASHATKCKLKYNKQLFFFKKMQAKYSVAEEQKVKYKKKLVVKRGCIESDLVMEQFSSNFLRKN